MKAEHQTYIIYDFESDVHTLTHKPNHVDADTLTVGDSHDYNDCKRNTFTYSGYDSVDKFCSWLFTDDHSHSTVIANNQAGYDGRFILQWCLNKGTHPSKFIRQGSRIMCMGFLKSHIRFVDSLRFYLEPLQNLSSTYNTDTLESFFPHFFNIPEHQAYVGNARREDMYGARNTDADTYSPEFKPWCNKIVAESKNDLNFRNEMVKYCRVDAELLSKAVLPFRKMLKDKLDIDPFRCVAMASVRMAVFRGCFLPDKSIVANGQHKSVSKACKEWLLHLQDDKLIPEAPTLINKSTLTYDKHGLHRDKLDEDTRNSKQMVDT